MTCTRCGGSSYERVKRPAPVERHGITFRVKRCLNPECGHRFLSAEMAITDEFSPVERLDAALKELMDESDARAQAEIEAAESLEEIASDEE